MREANDVAGDLLLAVGMLRRRLQQLPVADRTEITTPEMSALARLERGGPQTSADLAKSERVTPQSMSTTIAGLEAKGLIARDLDPTDRRRSVVSLTRVGHTAVAQRRSVRRQLVGAVLTDFPADDIEVLRKAAAIIERLAEAL